MERIRLTKGRVTIVDNKDYKKLIKWKWCFHNSGYAFRMEGKKGVLMHRLILKAKKGGDICDHINRDKLDNRRKNLRIVSFSQSNQNKDRRRNNRFTGVQYIKSCYGKRKRQWRAYIYNKTVGYYKTEEEAALAYNEKAKEYFGKNARLNQL